LRSESDELQKLFLRIQADPVQFTTGEIYAINYNLLAGVREYLVVENKSLICLILDLDWRCVVPISDAPVIE
jgi:hypothetical protein